MDQHKFLSNRHVGAVAGPEVAQYHGKEVVQSSENDKEAVQPGIITQDLGDVYQQQWSQQTLHVQRPVSQITTPPHQQWPQQNFQDQDFNSPGTIQPRDPSRKQCGIGRNGWIWLALLIALAIGGAVGGGIGGSVAVERAKASSKTCSSSTAVPQSAASTGTLTSTGTPTSESTSTSAGTYFAVPTDVATDNVALALDCANLNGTQTVSAGKTAYNFEVQCGRDFVSKSIIDILAATTYSLEDCLRTCATYNANLGRDGCVAVTFDADISNYVKYHDGNCFIKNSTGTAITVGDRAVGAQLLM
ncbi:hypothetical protein BJ170DRAFT_283403 [Xylariales sp. AK1849]|nr:hypothetical protein BJ170DRAFT_283403 [Xylariales sp. AK1849]